MNKKQKINTESVIANDYIYIILCLFPLFFNNYYFDLTISKFRFFLISSLLFFVASVTCYVIKNCSNFKNIKFKKLNILDISMLSFTAVCAISTLLSEHKINALTGSSGRYVGLITITVYCLIYFFITRFATFKTSYFNAFLVVGIFICLFGITDYFQMDLLGFKFRMVEAERNIFTSTFGNLNIYTVYVGMFICISFILFCTENELKKSVFYYICTLIGYIAIIIGTSDNAYIMLGMLFVFSPFYLFKKSQSLIRYLLMILGFLCSVKIIYAINIFAKDKVIGIESIFNILSENNLIYLGIVLLAVLIGFLYFKYKSEDVVLTNNIRYVWGAFIALGFIAFVALFVILNSDPSKSIGSLTEYFIFKDSWGSNRGYIWRKCMEFFKEFSLPRKLFGLGPDTFGILTNQRIYDEMLSNYGVVFDSPHNEYMQYLITTGLLGVASYVLFMVNALIVLIKKAKDNRYMLAVLFVAISYLAQAFININNAIVTPIFMVILFVGLIEESV